MHTKIVSAVTIFLAITVLVVTQNYTSATTYPGYPTTKANDDSTGFEQMEIEGIFPLDEADENITGQATLISGIGEASNIESSTIVEPEAGPEIFTRELPDTNMTEFGQWNPGRNRTNFYLEDPLIDGSKSTINANTIDYTGTNPICDAAYVGYGWFVLKCTEPPV